MRRAMMIDRVIQVGSPVSENGTADTTDTHTHTQHVHTHAHTTRTHLVQNNHHDHRHRSARKTSVSGLWPQGDVAHTGRPSRRASRVCGSARRNYDRPGTRMRQVPGIRL